MVLVSERASERLGRLVNESSLHRLYSFERPFHVVRAWAHAHAFLDEIFQVDPETHLLQRVVQPARGDAKVSVMWSHVVNAMMYAWQYEMHVLQNGDVLGQAKVSMRPLVKLKKQENSTLRLFVLVSANRS